MATLETIRTRAGVLISIVIGLALVSFIVSPDTFSMAMSMFSDDNNVGRVRGNAISYQEYDNRVNRIANLYRAGGNSISDSEMKGLRDQVWATITAEYVFVAEAEKIGLTVTDEELTDAMTGADPHPSVKQMFTNPNTGQFDRTYMSSFIQQLDSNPVAKDLWLYLEDEVKLAVLTQKYWALDERSVFVSSVEATNTIQTLKNNSNFSYVVKEYSSIDDSEITLTESAIKDVYNRYKNTLWKDKGVDIEYALFSVEPQAFDFEKVAREMANIETKMNNENVENLGQFVSLNSENNFDDVYFGKGQVRPMELDSFAFAGNIGDSYPVFQVGNTYYTSRIKDIKTIADSASAEHILLSPENISKADSIIEELNKGASFADLAAQYSTEPGANISGGDLGWFAYGDMVRPFSDSCFYNSSKGKMTKVYTRFGFHIVRVKGLKDYTKKVQLATVEITVEAGRETYADFYNKASKLISDCKGDGTKFAEVAAENGVRLLEESDINYASERVLYLNDSKNLIRWACGAKVNDLSEVIDVESNTKFVVAKVKSIRDRGIETFESAKPEMERIAMKEKKAEKIANEMSGFLSSSTIDEFAGKVGNSVSSSSSPVSFLSSFIPGLPVQEPKLVGAISAAEPNKLVGPIHGENGVYVLSVTSVEESDAVSLEESKTNLFERRLGQTNIETNKVLQKVGDLIDNRGKFY